MEPCRIEWITIPAPDLEAAKAFYGNVFGFDLKEFNERFWVFKAGNLGGGLDRDLPVAPPGIGFSITVSDIPDTLRTVIEHGGQVLSEPYSLGPGAGFCARVADPNGNVLELYSESPPESGERQEFTGLDVGTEA
ncbi:MAG: VOC family protein [Candidatus Eisenbacteria bacterium]|jgi:hypothetical protein|nr:VOC family protein [Candidatus Eisenbacteria bacterium]